nr:hypothetical protein [Jeotgalibacillus malaysiensis]
MSELKKFAAAFLVTISITSLTQPFTTNVEHTSQIAFGDEVTTDGRDRVVMPPV